MVSVLKFAVAAAAAQAATAYRNLYVYVPDMDGWQVTYSVTGQDSSKFVAHSEEPVDLAEGGVLMAPHDGSKVTFVACKDDKKETYEFQVSKKGADDKPVKVEWKGPTLDLYDSEVRVRETWILVQKALSEGKDIKDAAEAALKDHSGINVVFLADSLENSDVKLKYSVDADGVNAVEVTRSVQSGALFTASVLPTAWRNKEVTLKIEHNGEDPVSAKIAQGTDLLKLAIGDHHFYMGVVDLHRSSDSLWREVQDQWGAEGHKFWDSSTQTWKAEALEKLYKDTLAKGHRPNRYEREGGVVDNSLVGHWKLIAVIAVVVLLAAAFSYYWFCLPDKDEESDSVNVHVNVKHASTEKVLSEVMLVGADGVETKAQV